MKLMLNKIFYMLTYNDISFLTRQIFDICLYGCLNYSKYLIWDFIFYYLSLFLNYIIILMWMCGDAYWVVKLSHPPFFSFSFQNCMILIIGYDLDSWVNGWIDRISLIPDQMIKKIKFIIMQNFIIMKLNYYYLWISKYYNKFYRPCIFFKILL